MAVVYACRTNRPNPQEREAMPCMPFQLAGVTAAAVALLAVTPLSNKAAASEIERGKYLVTLGGCNDCHTPGYFFGKPDMTKYLGGSQVGFEIPDLGVFHGPN